MRRLFLALFLLGAINVAHASPLPTLDMDELLFSSDEVVEGPIVAVHERNYSRTADVRVEKTSVGRDLSGHTIPVSNLELYTESFPEGRLDQLRKGDRAIFFVRDSKAHPAESYLYQGARYWVNYSGVRLIRLNRVSGFTQYSNPGGYDELPPVSRAVFDAGFAASRARIADLQTHLRAPVRAQDYRYFVQWQFSRAQRLPHDGHRFFSDTLSQALDERLRQIRLLSQSFTPIP